MLILMPRHFYIYSDIYMSCMRVLISFCLNCAKPHLILKIASNSSYIPCEKMYTIFYLIFGAKFDGMACIWIDSQIWHLTSNKSDHHRTIGISAKTLAIVFPFFKSWKLTIFLRCFLSQKRLALGKNCYSCSWEAMSSKV